MKPFKFLCILLCLCLLTACGAGANDWEVAETDRVYQSTVLSDSVSTMELWEDSLYLKDAETGQIIQYGGEPLLTADNSDACFTVSEDSLCVLAEPIDAENFALHIYDLSSNTQTDVDLSVDNLGMAHLQCSNLLVFQNQIILSWTGADENFSDCRYGLLGINTASRSIAFSHSLSAPPGGLVVLDDELYAAVGDRLELVTETTMESKASFSFQIQAITQAADGSLLLADEYSLYQWVPDTKQLTELLRWGDVLINSAPTQLAADSQGRIYCLANQTVFCCIPQTVTETEKTLILATDSPQSVSQMVSQFNASHTDYQIQVKSYSSEDSSRLNVDFATGDTPDIFCFGDDFYGTSPFQPNVYAAKGMLTDLYSFLDTDSELSRNSFLPNILSALETEDGSIYILPSGFWIDIVVGNRQVIGDSQGWSFQEMENTLSGLGYTGAVLGPHMTQDLLLQFVLAYNQKDFVDWTNGACNFDSDEFGALLEFVAQAPQSQNMEDQRSDYELIASGEQLLMYDKLGNFKSIQKYYQNFGTEDLNFIGFPTSSGIGNAISYDMSLAISSSCQAPDVAWEFVREFYLDTYDAPAFPINQTALKRKMAQEQVDEDGGAILSYSNGFEVHLTAPSQEDCEAVLDLIDSLDRVYQFDRELYQIVLEEATAYFQGDKSLDAVLSTIQNREQIYIAEKSK